MMLLPEIAKMPPASKLGAAKPTVPVNGDPSLIVAAKVATTAPGGVESGIVGLLGVTVITGDAGGGGGGGGGAAPETVNGIDAKVLP